MKCDTDGQGWIDKDIILAGTLHLIYSETKNLFHVSMTFDAEKLSTYGRTFVLSTDEKRTYTLLDKSIQTAHLSDSEQEVIKLIKDIAGMKRQEGVNTIAILKDGVDLMIGVIATTTSCLAIPETGTASVITCIGGIGETSIKFGSLTYNIYSNEKLKEKIQDNTKVILKKSDTNTRRSDL